MLVAAGVHYFWGWNPWWLAAGAVVAGVINVACGAWIEKRWGKDPGEVVIDEVAGQWIALMAPIAGAKPLWGYTAAFFLFRIFDILKPLGARRLEALPRGWGVLLDDVLSESTWRSSCGARGPGYRSDSFSGSSLESCAASTVSMA